LGSEIFTNLVIGFFIPLKRHDQPLQFPIRNIPSSKAVIIVIFLLCSAA